VTRADTGGRWALSYAGTTISTRELLGRVDGSVIALVDITDPDGRRKSQVVVLPAGTGEVDWFRSFVQKPGCAPIVTVTATAIFALACGTLEAVALPG
jgi:hypothetical protein